MANHVEDTLIMNRPSINPDNNNVERVQSPATTSAGTPLLKAHPSWWNYFWYLFFCWLIVPLIIALWKRAGLLLSVYADRVVLERGVLSKQVTQVLISDIRSVDTRQSFGQRLIRVGDILIGTAAMAGFEIVARGLPDPGGVAALIMRQRQSRGGNQD